MGIVCVTVNDPFIDAFQEATREAILGIESVGPGRRYTLLVPEMSDCEGDMYPVASHPVFMPFACWDPDIEIWIVPHINCI